MKRKATRLITLRKCGMTVDEIKSSSQRWLTSADIAPILECDPNLIRRQAQADPSKLGFPVVVLCSRIKINRVGFLRFLGEENAASLRQQD